MPTLAQVLAPVADDLARIAAARHHDPSAILGRHRYGRYEVVLVHAPGASRVLVEPARPLKRLAQGDFFAGFVQSGDLPTHYRLRVDYAGGQRHEFHDPYSFAPQLDDGAIARFSAGDGEDAWHWLGAHPLVVDGIAGTLFAVWAPNAERVSVVGPFNLWDGRRHPLRNRGASGVWELFVPGIAAGELYKFELRQRDTGALLLKTDPYGRWFERRPDTAAIVAPGSTHAWGDAAWMAARQCDRWLRAPMSIYEVHLGSWQRWPDGGFRSYRELAVALADHVAALGFTHVELLPITEHPLDDSWGYQCTGFFAPTSRHGTPDDFRAFVDHLHQRGIGVLLDWVPAHFPRDAHALARFDGTPLYEYADSRKAEHLDWGTLVFNYERNEVRSFLLASACYWLEEFHIDGLRCDAVASMLYLDYGRKGGEWLPNRHGGRENLEAVSFLRRLNELTHARFPGTVTIAEESTAWPLVSRPVHAGGLGFSMKWNMGWMHDTLDYFSYDPVYRSHHHDRLTFGMMYAYSENFVLPFSHDEVVHLKRSLFGRMPGDDWQRYANLRLLLAWQWTWPGRKLLFMGAELAQDTEWNSDVALPWSLGERPANAGVARLLGDLNHLYVELSALHARDFEPAGFQWLDCNDRAHSTLAFLRRDGGQFVVVLFNFTPVPREGFRVGVPHGGTYRELLNTDSMHYGGSNLGNSAMLGAEPVPAMGQPCSLVVTLPPLAAVILRPT